MPIQIGQRVAHRFDQPLGLLSDCHRRIEHFLEVLVKVTNDAAGRALTADYRTALEGAVRYFAVAAPKHTADEEISLFPRLRASGDPNIAEALSALDKLERDHEEADQHHASVDTLVRRWLENDRLAPSEVAELQDHLGRLQTLYHEHIAIEDRQVFPAAAGALGPAEIAAVGAEMAARRGVQPLNLRTSPE